jgi:hypothetical protein
LKLVIGPDEEEWELIDQAEDSPPASFLRQCLEEEGIPYQMVKVPHPDVVGDGIECDLGSRAENEAFIRRARERWGKEEWDGRHS